MRADLSLDDLVRTQQQRPRDREAQRLRRRQVDYQFKFGWLFDWKIAGFGTLEDVVDVGGSTVEIRRHVRPITHETSGIAVFAFRINRWQSKLLREFRDAATLTEENRICRDEEGRDVRPAQFREGSGQFGGTSAGDTYHLDAERLGGIAEPFQIPRRHVRRVTEDANAAGG